MFENTCFLYTVHSIKNFFFCFFFVFNHVSVKVKSKKQFHHICLYALLMKGKKEILEYKIIKNVKHDKYLGIAKKKDIMLSSYLCPSSACHVNNRREISACKLNHWELIRCYDIDIKQ